MKINFCLSAFLLAFLFSETATAKIPLSKKSQYYLLTADYHSTTKNSQFFIKKENGTDFWIVSGNAKIDTKELIRISKWLGSKEGLKCIKDGEKI